MKHKKGFTLVELLVVIGIIALLVSILMPALGRARELAKRIQCASQLNGLGKAVAMYQNEYRDANPKPWRGVGDGTWGFGGDGSRTIYNPPGGIAYNWWCNPDSMDYQAVSSVGLCLYLLVKHEDVDVKMFVCPSSDDTVMLLEDAIELYPGDVEDWSDLRDFQSNDNLSYSYNDPWHRILDSSASAAQVLMADKSNAYDYSSDDDGFLPNPDCVTNGKPWPNGDASTIGTSDNDCTWDDDGGDNQGHGNSRNHGSECQNVLFADTHVKKYATPCVGVNEDNIYSFASASTAANVPMTYYMIGLWANGGNGDGVMYESGDPISGPSDKDSYLGN
ncbi:MAG: type II secretion system GspH family protein [Bacteroidales bacterium]|nr:type II secretion system GspH family protein [Bacteroidales bacterium]